MTPGERSFWKDLSTPAVVAGFVAVLVGFTSSVAIVFAAAQTVGATPAQTTSWMWALGLGMGLTSIALAWHYRMPLLTAWSTPGAALIAGSHGFSMSEAVGAFVASGALMALAGATGLFARVMDRIPQAIAAALLAGVLARFGLDAILAVKSAPQLVIGMALAFLVARRVWPRYAVPVTFVAGIAIAAAQGQLAFAGVHPQLALPQWTTPAFTAPAFIGLALPLFIVTMASQNLPGVAVQRAAGYTPVPVSGSVATTGIATVLLAPFGGYALNLAAITAAICASPQAGDDPARRYTAVISAGVFYCLIGLAGGAVVQVLQAFPRELVLAIAGLALLGTIASALASALAHDAQRDAAGLTFLVALSGISVAGIGSAFWAVVAGAVALGIQAVRRRSPAR